MDNLLNYLFHQATGMLFATSILGILGGTQNSTSSIPASVTPPILAPVEYRINTTPQYSLINPLIFIDTDQRLFPEFNNFDKQISTYVDSAQRKNEASSVSVYLRDMNSGHWTGTNENELYEPGSMLKVAVLIAYERYAMDQSTLRKTTTADVLSQKLYYPGADESGQYYKSVNPPLAKGYHTILDILDSMIINSDNTALQILMKNQQDAFTSVYDDFRLPPSPVVQDGDFMTAKSYSVVFRSLFNGSYLNRSASEQALELLTKTTFNDGLMAGIPSSTVQVAHKFGERTYATDSGLILGRELHDCGIVYYPRHPYLLCVMTKGNGEYPMLAHVIADISKMAYEYVDMAANKK
jgi:beta-lactamase class A